MANNLNDFGRWIEDLKREIARIKSGAFLESSSSSMARCGSSVASS